MDFLQRRLYYQHIESGPGFSEARRPDVIAKTVAATQSAGR
jgi:hypothetical protein